MFAALAMEVERHRQFPSVGIAERQLEPAVRNRPLESPASLVGILATLFFLPVIFGINTFDLQFSGTGVAGGHDGFLALGVVREFVAWDFSFVATAAAAPPVGVACFGTTFRRADNSQLSVLVADPVAW